MPAFSRRHFLSRGAVAASAVAFGLDLSQAQALCATRALARLEEQTFFLPTLDPAHEGLRIAQLSDIHVGFSTPLEVVRGAIDAANAASPDLVVLTGDYLCQSRSGVGLMREQLGGLKAPTITILGNHDWWVDAQGAAQALKRHGYAVLQNENTTLTLRGEPFTVVGVDDLRTRHADVEQAFRGARAGSRLVLAHVPRTADLLKMRDEAMVVLSGHTHGGQINIPRVTAAITRLLDGETYYRGRFEIGKVQLHVNRGVGNSGPRLRVNSPPEVTLVTLRRGPATSETA